MNYPEWFQTYAYFLFWVFGALTSWLVKDGLDTLHRVNNPRKQTGSKTSAEGK